MTGKKPKTRPMKPSQSLEIQSTGLPDGVIELAASLPRPEECLDQTELTLWIRAGTYVFVSGLVLLAAWRHTLPDQCIVRLDDTGCNERVRRLITAAGTHQSLARQPPNDSAPASPARLLVRQLADSASLNATLTASERYLSQGAGHLQELAPLVNAVRQVLHTYLHLPHRSGPVTLGMRTMHANMLAEITVACPLENTPEHLTLIDIPVPHDVTVWANRGQAQFTAIAGQHVLMGDRDGCRQQTLTRPIPLSFMGTIVDLAGDGSHLQINGPPAESDGQDTDWPPHS